MKTTAVTGLALTILATSGARAAFDAIPKAYIYATTEIHGTPFSGAAWVEHNRWSDYPFDGSIIALTEMTEVDVPPPSNIVSFTGTLTPLGESGQRIQISFYGPNAMDSTPDDDLPIFVDLYGTYTDSDNHGHVLTGPVDLLDVGLVGLEWSGVDPTSLWFNPATAVATIVDTDGTVATLTLGKHPFRLHYDSGFNLGLYSADYSPWTPWVPELLDNADEVHISFDVYVPEPGAAVLLLPAALLRRRRR